MTDTDRAADASDRLVRLVFIYTLLGAAAFVGVVLVYVL